MTDEVPNADALRLLWFRGKARAWFRRQMGPDTGAPFKDQNEPMQHLVRELHLLRQHNMSFKDGDRLDNVLMLAEGATVTLAIEHFVRIVLGDRAQERDTLGTLLQLATAGPKPLLVLPLDDQADGRRKLCRVRNALMHGNFKQAAREAGCASVRQYFQTQFAGEIETSFRILRDLTSQIDIRTGRRFDAPPPDPDEERRNGRRGPALNERKRTRKAQRDARKKGRGR
jgi:hypothetical protein